MNEIMKIQMNMYMGKDFAERGFSRNINDAFIYTVTGEIFVIFVVEDRQLSGELLQYWYAVFSMENNSPVDSDTELYKEIVEQLPGLNCPQGLDAIPDFNERRRLEDELSAIIGIVQEQGDLTPGLKERYIDYLTEMKKLKTESFKPVYDFFINQMK